MSRILTPLTQSHWQLPWDLLQPRAFKISAQLGMVSYAINEAVKFVHPLSPNIQFGFPAFRFYMDEVRPTMALQSVVNYIYLKPETAWKNILDTH